MKDLTSHFFLLASSFCSQLLRSRSQPHTQCFHTGCKPYSLSLAALLFPSFPPSVVDIFKSFSFHFHPHRLQNLLCNPWQFFVPPFHEVCDIIHKTSQLQRRVHLLHLTQSILKHSAKVLAAPFRPREDGGGAAPPHTLQTEHASGVRNTHVTRAISSLGS